MALESQVVPKLGIWLSQRFLSRDCPSDICPYPKRHKRLNPHPSPKYWDPSLIAHPWSLSVTSTFENEVKTLEVDLFI